MHPVLSIAHVKAIGYMTNGRKGTLSERSLAMQ